jgi:hypothetical protein
MCLLTVALLPALTGCLHFAHPVPPVALEDWRPADDLTPESKNCVYVFLFNGHDPLGYCNMAGIRNYLHDIGFVKTYYGQAAHLSYFAAKMRELNRHCPESRFVIVGFDYGAETAQDLAVEAKKAGIPIELLVYLEPQGTVPVYDPLANQVFTVRGKGPLFGSTDVIGAGDEVILEGISKAHVPTHPETLALLERELTLLAMTIGFPPHIVEEPKPLVDPIPAPREKNPRPKAIPPVWRMPTSYWGNTPRNGPTEMLPPPRVVPQ